MFIKLLWDQFRVSIRDKEAMVWTLLFPLMMSTLFYFALGSVDKADRLEAIPVAVVENAAYESSAGLSQMLQELSKGEEPLLTVTNCETAEAAAKLLEENEVDGYLRVEAEGPVLTVKKEGMNQTILRQVLTEYEHMVYSLQQAPEQAAAVLAMQAAAQSSESMLEKTAPARNNPSDMLGYFYSLLAMVCLFGTFQGATCVYQLQANQSALGARRCTAPQPYYKVLLAGVVSTSVLHMIMVWIALAYMVLVLQINFGGRVLLAALGCAAGSLTGVSLGFFLGSFPKLNLPAKIGLSVVVSLALCFLAGLMVGGMNYMVQQYLPIIGWLNPAARLVDALHSLYYFDTLQPFFLNVVILLAFSAVFFLLSALRLRRYQYESI